MDNNIFVRIYDNTKKVNKKEILNSIPENATNHPDEEQKKSKTEWRWRVYKINGKEYIEISFTKNNKKLFLNHLNKWISFQESELEKYKNFIVKEYYYYTE
jgi:uncharacterized FlgJ-related protein